MAKKSAGRSTKVAKRTFSPATKALLNECFAAIKSDDINAYATAVFSTDTEKWSVTRRRKATQAVMRFANLGWTFYHAMGETGLD